MSPDRRGGPGRAGRGLPYLLDLLDLLDREPSTPAEEEMD
jgi:hypothetical protein